VSGRVVVVTGAASGIGAAVAARFAIEGDVVIGFDLHASPKANHSMVVDLRQDAAIEAAIGQITEEHGIPTAVVHAAARCIKGGSVATNMSEWLDTYDVNVVAAARLLRACVPSMRKHGNGAFVFLSSINADFGTPTHAAYAASKAALNNLTQSAALEFAPDNIRINAISPASIDTPMLRASYGDDAALLNKNALRHPLSRLGTVDEVAELAYFLCSPKAGWITGSVYAIDGGASTTRR
jgi:NAD(P)-dependent dehydrogenase (short-subunit alcohol dehydrogenase family)